MKERLSAKTKNNKKKSTKLVHFIKEHLLRLMETKKLHLEEIDEIKTHLQTINNCFLPTQLLKT